MAANGSVSHEMKYPDLNWLTGKPKILQIIILFMLHFINPMRPRGGGGLRGPDGQTHSCQSETSYPMMPELGDL